MLWVGAVVVESVHWLGDDIGRVDVDVPAIEGGFYSLAVCFSTGRFLGGEDCHFLLIVVEGNGGEENE